MLDAVAFGASTSPMGAQLVSPATCSSSTVTYRVIDWRPSVVLVAWLRPLVQLLCLWVLHESMKPTAESVTDLLVEFRIKCRAVP